MHLGGPGQAGESPIGAKEIEVTQQQMDAAERILLEFNPEWASPRDTLRTLFATILGVEVDLRLCT